MLGAAGSARQRWAGLQLPFGTEIAFAERRHDRRGRFAMATELQGEQKELADFIRAGSSRGPQCFGSYFDEKGGSCALGAVYEGVYHLPRDHGKLIPDHLERLFRCLDEMTKKCPQGCNKRLPLASMIVHLNDDHRMTREQIAEWLTRESNV